MNNAIKCVQYSNLFKLAFKWNVGTSNNNVLRTFPVRFKGHSKWQNIRATKNAKDLEKSNLFNQLVKKLKLAIKGKYLAT